MSVVSVPTPTQQDATVDTVVTRACAVLIERNRLKASDLARARHLHEEDADGTLTALLTRLGLVSERDVADVWSELLDAPIVAAADAPASPPTDCDLSIRFLKHHHVVPVALDGADTLGLLVADPGDPYPMHAVTLAVARPVALRIGLRSDIDDLIERYYGSGRSAMGTIVENLEDTTEVDDDVAHLRDLASEAPVIRLVNLLIQHAVEQRASDIHIEPFESRLKMRYRIDGV
jgi:general secretion pathway protein E